MDKDLPYLTPNMVFVSKLPPDSKIKYFELLEEAQQEFLEFSNLLKEVHYKYKKAVNQSIELATINDNLSRLVFDKQSSNQVDTLERKSSNYELSQLIEDANQDADNKLKDKNKVEGGTSSDNTYFSEAEISF